MTTLYVDNLSGNDSTGNGTQAAPYKTYAKAYAVLGGNGQHEIYLKSGTVEDISATVAMRSGTSATARSFLGAWGFGPKPVLRINTLSTSGVMFHLNSSQFKTVRGVVFDANFLSKFGQQVYCSTGAITDLVFENCEYRNTSLVNSGQASLVQSDAASYPGATGVVFRGCKFSGGSQHGGHCVGNVSVRYERCETFGNGVFDPSGGHGFSSYAGIINSVTSGWTNVSGTIYSRAITTTVYHVTRTTGTATALKQNTSTPTTPASGEWGQSGGTLYINIGVDPSGVTVKFSYYAPTVVYDRCTSHDNNSIDGIEGTGFQADDFTGSFTAIRCKAYNNGGPGFFINQGAGAVLQDCLAYGNGNFGVAGQYAAGIAIDNLTAYGNCAANRSGYDADVKFQLGSRDVVIRNSVVQKTSSKVATATIRYDSTSTVGHSLTDVIYFGAPIQGTVTQTRVQNVDPLLSGDMRPQPGSPLIGAGSHLGYRRDIEMKQRRKPPCIGAFDAVKFKRA